MKILGFLEEFWSKDLQQKVLFIVFMTKIWEILLTKENCFCILQFKWSFCFFLFCSDRWLVVKLNKILQPYLIRKRKPESQIFVWNNCSETREPIKVLKLNNVSNLQLHPYPSCRSFEFLLLARVFFFFLQGPWNDPWICARLWEIPLRTHPWKGWKKERECAITRGSREKWDPLNC